MPVIALLALLGVIISAGSSIADSSINRAWQKEENEIMREREDTSVQRRQEDLEKAGINPMLAGLGGASAQPGHIMPWDSGGTDIGDMMANLGLNLPSMKKTKAETESIELDNKVKEKLTNTLLKSVGELNYRREQHYLDKTWEELSQEEKDSYIGKYDNPTLAEQNVMNEYYITQTQSWIQDELVKQSEINTEIAKQVKTLGGINNAVAEIMLNMTKEDYDILLKLGPEKAWERLGPIGAFFGEIGTNVKDFVTGIFKKK